MDLKHDIHHQTAKHGIDKDGIAISKAIQRERPSSPWLSKLAVASLGLATVFNSAMLIYLLIRGY